MTTENTFPINPYIPNHPSVKEDMEVLKKDHVAWLDRSKSEFEQQLIYDKWHLEWLERSKELAVSPIDQEWFQEQIDYVKRQDEKMRKLNDHNSTNRRLQRHP
jgi:hypothetical protein